MYTAFYGLREKPFSLTPNPRFLFMAESHREALAHLLYGLDQGEGFIVVSGEVGTGKTTICRTLLERLGVETELAFLFNPSGSGDEMLQSVNEEFGLPASGLSRRELLSQLNRFLLEKNRESKRVVLIIDEAQNLSTTTLEQVRLLSNLETTSSKLIQIVLLGQPELGEKLDSDELRQLRQRIGVRWQLEPLSLAETAQYVRHRLRVAAGADRAAIFDAAALAEVHRRTGGVPRLVNVLCDRALLAGYAAESAQIGVDFVKQAAAEIRDLQAGTAGSRAKTRGNARGKTRGNASGRSDEPWRAPWWWVPLAAVLAGAAVGFGMWLGRGDGVGAVRGWLEPGATPAVSAPSSRPARAAGLPPVSARPPAYPTARLGSPRPQVAPPAPVDLEASTPALESIDSAHVSRAISQSSSDASDTRIASFPASPAEASVEDDGSFLAHLLADVAPTESRAMAVSEILEVWGRPDDGVRVASEAGAFERLHDAGLEAHTIYARDLDELAQLDHPTLIEVFGRDDEAHWLALVELRPAVAFVGGVVDRGPIGVSYDALERRFTGRAHVVWSPGVDLSPDGMLRDGSEGEQVKWLQQALFELGYMGTLRVPVDDAPAVYDAATRLGVRRFQRANGLLQDGITGPVTLMRLDDALGRRERPHLETGAAS